MSVLAALCYRAYRPFKAIVINNKFVVAANKRKGAPTGSSATTPIASQATATPTLTAAAAGGGSAMGAKLSVRASSLRIQRTSSHEAAPLIMSDVPESQRLKENSLLAEDTRITEVDSDPKSYDDA
jgi:hypothetical protein